ncbi:endolytic transglycosylase MltG [Nocardioides sambongensis]|uniref:endolytic transglycosylase MltG n=1 Tax=Nocardioides sambongensis TaxID=2589074 RepID=UPI001125C22B|nr:endolytic transglycosylase MltG [Nocardioides sambongensis]
MTEPVLPMERADTPVEGGRRRGTKRRSGCLPVLVVAAIFAALLAYFVPKGLDEVREMFAAPEDYPGPGSGKVSVVIEPGESIPAMGDELAELDVVASAEAFVDAASANPDAQGIQAGSYVLKKQMSAADAVAHLADPANVGAGNTVTVPEGARVGQIVEAIVDKSDFTAKELTRLLDNPDRIGLPAEADGNPEGYLFPATYEITADSTPRSLLSEMVDQTVAVEEELKIEQGAGRLGLTVHEVMTVASIIEREVNREQDYPKVARVIYNRLDDGMPLQMDSTAAYASQREGDVWTTDEERASDSPYNTYRHTGLPPGPIGSPGRATIDAALNPADGDWLYFVADFENGGTLFADNYADHQANVAEVQEYCRNSDEC